MAEPAAFDQKTPPLHVTDPEYAKAHPNEPKRPYEEYPRHLHKADGSFLVVTNDFEKARELANGWHLTPAAAKAAQVEPTVQEPAAVVTGDAPKKRGPKPKVQESAA